MFTKTCPKCGSDYEFTKLHTPMRDKDKIDCDVCGEELIRWNGGLYYTYKMLRRKELPKETN